MGTTWKITLAVILVIAFIIALCVATGCAAPGEGDQSVSAPVSVATGGGAAIVDAPTITEMERFAAGGVKADSARDIRTFGLDAGTLELLTRMLGKLVTNAWRLVAIMVCIGVGSNLMSLVIPTPDMKLAYKTIVFFVGLSLIVIPLTLWAMV